MYNNVPASRLVPFGLLHVAKSIDLCQNICLLTAYQLVYHEESDPDWEPSDADEVSSEDYTEGEEEDLDQLNRDAMLPLVEVLKDAKISLRTLMKAELARGYQ